MRSQILSVPQVDQVDSFVGISIKKIHDMFCSQELVSRRSDVAPKSLMGAHDIQRLIPWGKRILP